MSLKPSRFFFFSNLEGASAPLTANVCLTDSPQPILIIGISSPRSKKAPTQLPQLDTFSPRVLLKSLKCSPRPFYQGQRSVFSTSTSRLEAIQLAISAAVIQVITLRTPCSSQEEMYVRSSRLGWPRQAAANGCTKKNPTTSECICVPKKVDLLKQKNNLLKFVYVIYS